jgi:uncharacterized protein DUF2688
MKKTRITIITTSCRRCGRTLATASRSIHGADRAKAQLGSICESCITPAERIEILNAIGGAILAR